MNIVNPVSFGEPDLTLTTSNAIGTGNAIRTGASILTYDGTLPVVSTNGGSSAVGTASTSARRDHKHGLATINPLASTIISSSRTSASGSGDQALTGCGFQPSAAIAFGVRNSSAMGSMGIADDAVAESLIVQKGDGDFTYNTGLFIYALDGSNGQYAVVKSFDADGLTLTWATDGTGQTVHFTILCLK